MTKKRRTGGEGTLRQRKYGRWEWRTPPKFPIKKSLYSRTQEDVLRKRDEFLRDFLSGGTRIRTGDTMIFRPVPGSPVDRTR